MKILCTSDNHIGSRQYGLKQRETDFMTSFRSVIELAYDRDISTVLVSGDMLDSKKPSVEIIDFLSDLNEWMSSKQIDCVLINGNHDDTYPNWTKPIAKKQYGFRHIETGEVFEKEGYRISGVNFIPKVLWPEIKQTIPTDLDVLLMHQPFKEFAHFEGENLFNADDLEGLNSTFIIVGDIHVPRDFNVGRSTVISPGSTELCSAGEISDKSVTCLDLKDSTFERIPIETRKVYKFSAYDTTAVEELTTFSNKRKFEDQPLVFVKFDQQFETEVFSCVKKLKKKGVFVRSRPVMSSEEKEKPINLAGKTIRDLFLEKHGSEEISSLGESLLHPDCDVNIEIDSYIERKLQEEK